MTAAGKDQQKQTFLINEEIFHKINYSRSIFFLRDGNSPVRSGKKLADKILIKQLFHFSTIAPRSQPADEQTKSSSQIN